MMIFMIIMGIKTISFAEDINIYDAPTDKTKSVVEYCPDDGYKNCKYLIIDKNVGDIEYPTIEKWVDEQSNKEYNKK